MYNSFPNQFRLNTTFQETPLIGFDPALGGVNAS